MSEAAMDTAAAEAALAQLAWTGCDPELTELRLPERLSQLQRRVAAVSPAWAAKVAASALARGEDPQFAALWAQLQNAPLPATPDHQLLDAPLDELLARLPALSRARLLADERGRARLHARLSEPSPVRGPLRWLAALRAAKALPAPSRELLLARAEREARELELPRGSIAVLLCVSGAMRAHSPGQKVPRAQRRSALHEAAELVWCLLRARPDALLLPHSGGALEPPAQLVAMPFAQGIEALLALPYQRASGARPLARCAELGAPDWVFAVGEQRDLIAMGSARAPGPWGEDWMQLRALNPAAKCVMINVHPSAEPPPPLAPEILRVYGCSDHLFSCVSLFERDLLRPERYPPLIG